MATTRSTLQLVIQVLDRSRAGFRGLRTRLGDITRSIFNVQNALRGAFVVTAGLALKRVFELGSGLGETRSRFVTVFGPQAVKELDAFIGTFARMAGVSRTVAEEMLGTTGAIAQGLGFAQDASAEFAQSVFRLAADLGSFNNLPTADVLQRINAALTGERESLKRLGVVILETDVQERALLNTRKRAVGSLTQQEKATATLQLITEKAGVAVGDLERTSDSAANKWKQLGAIFTDVRDNIAAALVPQLERLVDRALEAAGGADGLAESVGEKLGKAAKVGVDGIVLLIDNIHLLIAALKLLGAIIVGRVVLGALAGLAAGAVRAAGAIETLRIALLLAGDGAKGFRDIATSLGLKIGRGGPLIAAITAAALTIDAMADSWKRSREEAEKATESFLRGGIAPAQTAEEAEKALPALERSLAHAVEQFELQQKVFLNSSGGIQANARNMREFWREQRTALTQEIARLKALMEAAEEAVTPGGGGGGGGGGGPDPLEDLKAELKTLSEDVARETNEVALERARLEAEVARLEETLARRQRAAEFVTSGGELPGVRNPLEEDPALNTDTLPQPGTMIPEFERLDVVLQDIKAGMVDFGIASKEAFGQAIAGAILFGQGFGEALRQGIARAAAAKGAFYAAESLGALAQGFLGNPGAFAAAAKYAAASAAMFTLAGALGGGGGSRGAVAGGGGGGVGGAQDRGLASFEDRGAATIIINGGLLDMNDPRQADALAQALEELTGRRVFVQTGG